MKYKKRVLIYDDEIRGHHLEYIHHLHEGATQNKEIDFIFAIPNTINDKENKLVWEKSDNIKYHLLSDSEINLTGNSIVNSFKRSRIARKIAIEYNVNEIFFNVLIGLLPAATFVIPKNIKISGIIYMIYLYRWKRSSFIIKLFDSIKYILLSRRGNFNNVFILNDKSAPVFLNRKFKTSKFLYLPDPFMPIGEIGLINIREKYKILSDNIIYLHFGSMAESKGTLEILNALIQLRREDLIGKTFIFAGRVGDNIKDMFYEKYHMLKDKVQIIVFDEFCEYSFLGSLCLSSDYILLPYKRTSQSSGVIGYGAQFNKPVVVPNKGLLGKLVRKYNLGYLIESPSTKHIIEFIRDNKAINKFNSNKKFRQDYIREHNVSHFINLIFSKLIS